MGKKSSSATPEEVVGLYHASVSWQYAGDEQEQPRGSQFLDNMPLGEQMFLLESLRDRKAEALPSSMQHALIEFLEVMVKESMRKRVKQAVLEVSLSHRAETAISADDAYDRTGREIGREEATSRTIGARR